MKDASDQIRDWVYTVLNGTVSYGGSVVPVYSFPPKDQAYPYMVIAEHMMTGEGESTKDAYLTGHEITVEIYTESTGNDASYVPANTIADSALQLLRTRTKVTGITGYNTISVVTDNMITERVITDRNIIIYKSINMRLLLEEN